MGKGMRTKLPALLTLGFFGVFSCVAFGGCVAASGDGSDGSDESEPAAEDGRTTESMTVGVDCSSPHSATGYKNGSSFTITVVEADGHPIEVHTAAAYAAMQHAAAKDGIALRVVSGFRTMAQQEYLYGCYVHCSCNGCNLAARPGYSNHQSGHALDLNTSSSGVYHWLENHASAYGFKRTVPSEIWHWEYWGSEFSSCTHTAAPPPSGTNCYSHTLGREVPMNTCVQSASDRLWYQCNNGHWVDRWSDPAACVSVHPL